MKTRWMFGVVTIASLTVLSALYACGDTTAAGDAGINGDDNNDKDGGGDSGSDGDTDIDTDTDGDVDGDVDGDADGDVDASLQPCPENAMLTCEPEASCDNPAPNFSCPNAGDVCCWFQSDGGSFACDQLGGTCEADAGLCDPAESVVPYICGVGDAVCCVPGDPPCERFGGQYARCIPEGQICGGYPLDLGCPLGQTCCVDPNAADAGPGDGGK